jgi:hypothetical protein
MFDLDEEELQDDCIFSKDDLIGLAKTYLSLFFKNRLDSDGNPMDPEILFSERNISLVLNCDICSGMPLFYDAVKSKYRKENIKRKGKIQADVECVLQLLNQCSKVSVPKCFAAGLIAVYAEMCEGCQIDI